MCWLWRLLGLGLVCITPFAVAENLADVYQQAIQNDQLFQNATATRQAAAENLPQAMAVLFPHISAQASSAMQRSWSMADVNPNFTTGGLVKNNTNGYQVTLTMPLIDFNQWYQVREAKSQVKQADATYAEAAQNLIMRTATAYFDVLSAEDLLENNRAQKDLLAKQLKQANARFSIGVDAKTTVYNVQAQYDAAVAQEIAGESALYAAYQNLYVITKKPINRLSRLVDDLPLWQPNPNNSDAWQKAAEAHNFSLLALRYATEAARSAISASKAKHLPVLSTSEQYTRIADSPSVAQSNGMRATNSSVGVAVNLPLFQGGQVLSETRQAQDVYLEASTTMERTHREVLAKVLQTYRNILSDMVKIKADRAAIQSANSALSSNQAAYQAGTMTIIDVLNAITNLYQAKRTYSTDQYGYLLNTLALKQLAGTLTSLDVVALNHYLKDSYTIPASELAQKKISTPDVF
jgi:outer membrane protein